MKTIAEMLDQCAATLGRPCRLLHSHEFAIPAGPLARASTLTLIVYQPEPTNIASEGYDYHSVRHAVFVDGIHSSASIDTHWFTAKEHA